MPSLCPLRLCGLKFSGRLCALEFERYWLTPDEAEAAPVADEI